MKQTLLFLSLCLVATAVQAQQQAPKSVFSNTSVTMTDAVRAGTAVDVQAVEQITTAGAVEKTATATYTAGKAIVFQPGFEARAGSVLLATISPVSARSAELGSELTLSAWPNPFQDMTTVEYKLPENTTVTHILTDARGVILRQTNPTDSQAAGVHKVRVEGNDLPTGVYLYQLQTGNQTKVIRLLKQ